MQELLHRIAACTICAHNLPHGPRPVVQADPKASILIAGQAPGRKVHESGVPFDDASGNRLRDWLGVDRQTFYDPRLFAIVPMGFCYPGTGSSGDLPPRPECAPKWRVPLLTAMPNIRLTLILGQYAVKYHLENPPKTVTAAVRQWPDHWPDRLVLPHPSPRNQRWFKQNAWFAEEILPRLRIRIDEILHAR